MDIMKRAPVVVNPIISHAAEQRESLSGQWKIRLDQDDVGIKERWYANASAFYETVTVPGSWQGQGFGKIEDDFVWDFSYVVRTFRATYKGTGWYCKTFRPDPSFKGRRVWLNFGGAHPTAEVWLNGIKLGENHEPFVPFAFDITGLVCFAEDNTVIVRISETDRLFGMAFSWQGSWSGLYRDVELTATGETYLDSCSIYGDVDRKTVTVKIRTGGTGPCQARFSWGALGICRSDDPAGWQAEGTVRFDVTDGYGETTIEIADPLLWSPDAPNLYRADIVLMDGETQLDACSDRFGFVKLSTAGKHLLVNVDCPKGELKVEVLDKDGKVIEPFTLANCKPVSCDKTLAAVTWKSAADLSAVSGKPVQFRFHLKNGSLYAFWVSPDKSGASHGYVAAGGPGFTGPTDTIGGAQAQGGPGSPIAFVGKFDPYAAFDKNPEGKLVLKQRPKCGSCHAKATLSGRKLHLIVDHGNKDEKYTIEGKPDGKTLVFEKRRFRIVLKDSKLTGKFRGKMHADIKLTVKSADQDGPKGKASSQYKE